MTSITLDQSRNRYPSGMTLLEIVIVVAILAILAGFIVPLLDGYAASSKVTAAQASLATIRDAIVGTPDKPGYYSDTGQLPNTLADLFIQPPGMPSFNRDTNRGWRGPYLLNSMATLSSSNSPQGFTLGAPASSYTTPYGALASEPSGNTGDPVIIDPWGNAIFIQWPTSGSSAAQNQEFVRLISAGPNKSIDTPQNYLDSAVTPNLPYPPPNVRGDDIVLFLNHSDSPTP
jgi:prepilin-type N-terminal cleavage/methylation domain-containing protein